MAIMLIDDDDLEAIILRRRLARLGYSGHLEVFEYADRALEYLKSPQRPRVKLILCDVNLPRMSGMAFADAFAALYPELRDGTVFYLVSGSIDPRDRSSAEAHPATAGFLTKPFGNETLTDVLQKAGLGLDQGVA